MMNRLAGITGCLLAFGLVAVQGMAETPRVRAVELLEQLGSPSASRHHIGVLLGGPSAGISVAVAVRGNLVLSQGTGYADLANLVPATSSTVYNVGSVSKVMTAVAVLQLVEQGKVSLDDPIQKHVPAFPEKRSPVTVWQILTHTSGIRHYLPDDFPNSPSGDNVMPTSSLEESIRVFKDDPLLFESGDFYKYSSYAVNLLQGVVETASGLSFEDYLRENIWIPAGMLHTGFDIPTHIVPGRARGYVLEDGMWVHHPYADLTYKLASGGMTSTAEDLVRFGLAVTRGRLLAPETVKTMFTVQLKGMLDFDERKPLRWEQCLMWRIRKDEEGRSYVHHCGTIAGFNACLITYLEEDLIVAVVDNAAVTGLRTARAFADIFREPAAKETGLEPSAGAGPGTDPEGRTRPDR